jgi:hypothetical protein
MLKRGLDLTYDGSEGKRVYVDLGDGRLYWAVFQQQTRGTLASNRQLQEMVRAVGSDPANFRPRLEMADHVIDREAPLDTVREEDKAEMFTMSFPVNLGQPASGLFWGFGKLGDGTLTMAASTKNTLESPRY